MTQNPDPNSIPPGSNPPDYVPPTQGGYATPGDANAYQGPAPTKDEQTMAMICHITGIFGWLNWVGPLIFYLTRKDSAFIQDQSKQTLNWAFTVLIGFVCPLIFIWCPPIALLLFLAIGLTNLVFCIIAALKANQGIAYRFPFSIKFVK